jgi:hypothetical protein
MSIKMTLSARDAVSEGYVVAAPKTSDMVSGALCAAFSCQAPPADHFSALLLQIDLADRNLRRR